MWKTDVSWEISFMMRPTLAARTAEVKTRLSNCYRNTQKVGALWGHDKCRVKPLKVNMIQYGMRKFIAHSQTDK